MSGTGEHRHSESNFLGLHNHPDLDITEMGGGHEHDIDAFGSHFHWSWQDNDPDGEYYEGKSFFHVGGAHGHHDGDEMNSQVSCHAHVCEGVAVQKEVTITSLVGLAPKLAIIRKGTHSFLKAGTTRDEATALLKSEDAGEHRLVDDWAILYSHRDLDGCYLVQKSDYKNAKDRKKRVRRMAKSMAEILKSVEIARVTARTDTGLIVERIEKIEAVVTKGKAEQFPPSKKKVDEEKKKMEKGDPEVQLPKIDNLHSLVFEKNFFPTLARVNDWMRANDLVLDQKLETASEWNFFTGKGEEGDYQTRDIGGGVVAVFGKSDGFHHQVDIVKFDEEKGIVYGIVYEPYKVDSQGDWATPEDIETAAHDFLKSGQVSNVDTQHNFEANGSAVVESFIAREGDPDFPVGAWAVGVQVADHLRPLVKSGDINGFSMAGSGTRMLHEPLMKDDSSLALGLTSATVEIAKGMDEDKKKKLRKSHRLTNIGVGWISLVKRGANQTDFAFMKSDDSEATLVYKSAGQKLIDGEFSDQSLPKGFLSSITKTVTTAVMNALGRGQELPGASAPVSGRKDIPMPKIDGNTVGVLNILKGMVGRAALGETILQALAKSPALEPVLKADPELKKQIASMNPADLTTFEKALGDFLQQGSDNNGVTLPPVRNFMGLAMDPTVNPQRFFEGNFPGQMVAFGEPTVDKMPVSKEAQAMIDKLTKSIENLQTEIDSMKKGRDPQEAQKQEFQGQIASVLSPLQKSLDKLTSEVTALKKSHVQDGGTDDSDDDNGTRLSGAAPERTEATDVKKSDAEKKERDRQNAVPWDTADELFGGINLNRDNK